MVPPGASACRDAQGYRRDFPTTHNHCAVNTAIPGLDDRRRVVFENASFVGFEPFPAEVPCEAWIMPRRHQADCGEMAADERDDQAVAVRSLAGRLCIKLSERACDCVVNTTTHMGHQPQLHWYLRGRPQRVTCAGFVIGPGIKIKPSSPENDAAFLNESVPRAIR